MTKNKEKKPVSVQKRIAIIAVILVAFFLVNMIAARIVFHFIFNRYEYAENNTDPVYTSSDATNYPRDNFSFESGSNTLTGRLYHTKNAKGTVLIAHGIHSYGDRYLDITKYFVDHSWNVITFNMTGTYDSEGNDIVGLSQERKDVLAVLEYAQGLEELKNSPIVLFGHSMGGYAAATAIDSNDTISAVVCIGAFDKPSEVMYTEAKKYVGVVAKISYPFMWLENHMLLGTKANLSASKVLQGTQIPVLVVQGSEDTTITEDLSLYSRKDYVTNENVRFMLVEEAGRNEHSNTWLNANETTLNLTFMDQIEKFYSDAIQ